MWEEACVRVRDARLIGYAVSRHPTEGTVLVRSHWHARVTVEPWRPRFEVPHRRLVAAADAAGELRLPDEAGSRISRRALREANLLSCI
jgi:hypothetical protein